MFKAFSFFCMIYTFANIFTFTKTDPKLKYLLLKITQCIYKVLCNKIYHFEAAFFLNACIPYAIYISIIRKGKGFNDCPSCYLCYTNPIADVYFLQK